MLQKSNLIYLFFFIVIFFGCKRNENPCSLSAAVLKELHSLDSAIADPKKLGRYNEWNKDNYDEPSILQAANETYRLIQSNSFDSTRIYRVEKTNGQYSAIIKVFGEYDTVGRMTEFKISKQVWNNITDSLNAIGFWTYTSSIDRNGLDGSTWTLEGYNPVENKCTLRKYHGVSRWSPADTLFISMCKLLSQLKR